MLSRMLIAAMASICLSPVAASAQSTEAAKPLNATALRVALPLAGQSLDEAGCHDVVALTDPGASAYAKHLAARFKTRVELCLTDDAAQAAALAADEAVDMAWVDASSYQPLSDVWRPFLTFRTLEGLGRAPIVFFARADDEATNLSRLDPAEIGYLSAKKKALNIGVPHRVLEDYGFEPPATPGDEQLYPDLKTMMAAVAAGEIAVGATESSGWGRECAVLEKDKNPCAVYKTLISNRPQADAAMIIRRDMDKERFFRLTGVHVALHFEAQPAFDWISQGASSEFEPTEPGAMAPRPLVASKEE